MKKIPLVLLALIALPNLAMTALYVRDPLLVQRFFTLFNPQVGDYDTLRPREVVDGLAARELPVATDASRTISEDALASMRRYAEEQDSFALVVLHRGVIQTEWYAPGWSADSLTQSQSMHKSVLPLLIGAAIRDGAIDSVDDPAGRYLAEWRNDPRGEITLEQLMQMASGLLEYPFSLNPFSDAFGWLFASDSAPVQLRTPPAKAPGSLFEYNNVNSELLGLIVERATGKRYAEYFAEKLWRPIGGARAELWLDSEGGKAHSSCCLLATARDWARFGQLLLGRGSLNGRSVVDEDFFEQMITASRGSDWYGYQIWLGYSRELNPRAPLLAGGYQRTEPFDAEDTYYASGFGAQRVYGVPSAELVIVRMGPSSGRAPVRVTWDNSFLVNTALRGMREPNAQTASR
jgi:CubicO group peptidase (beta-lactamase class C family)